MKFELTSDEIKEKKHQPNDVRRYNKSFAKKQPKQSDRGKKIKTKTK